MSFVEKAYAEDLERIERNIALYLSQLNTLPKGVIRIKKQGARAYHYLHYREGSNVRNKYISAAKLQNLQTQLSQRVSLEKRIKDLKEDQRFLSKVLKRTSRKEAKG